MATDQSFADLVLENARDAGVVSIKKMFGEYALYCDGKVVGLVCDNQLFIKPTDQGREFAGPLPEGPAYPGSKPYWIIEEGLEDRQWLGNLVRITASSLPPPKEKKPKVKKP